MSVPQSVADILNRHVTFQLECIDRRAIMTQSAICRSAAGPSAVCTRIAAPELSGNRKPEKLNSPPIGGLSTKRFRVRILFPEPIDSQLRVLYALLVNHGAAFTGTNGAVSSGSIHSSAWPTAR